MSHLSYYVEKDHPDWTCLADLDESAAYEVDVTEIWRGDGQVWLVTATGCSCWDGDYRAEPFPDLTALDRSLYHDERKFTASPAGALALVLTARAALDRLA